MDPECAAQMAFRLKNAIRQSAGATAEGLISEPLKEIEAPPLQTLDEVLRSRASGVEVCEKCTAHLIRGVDSRICIVCGAVQQLTQRRSPFCLRNSVTFERFIESLQPRGLGQRR